MNRSRLVLAPAALALVLAACGGGNGDTASEAPASIGGASEAAAPSTAASEAAASEAATGGETVDLTGFAFTPGELTVSAGTEVTFTNGDGAAHTVTEGTDGGAAADARFDEEVPAGGEVTITFDEPGEYQVTCRFHPSMNMTVVVEG